MHARARYPIRFPSYAMLFAVIFAFVAAPAVADSSCSSYCPVCNSASIGASIDEAYSVTCSDATATPIITSVDVTDGDNDGDGFRVTLMDKANYDKYAQGQRYSYFSISGTGPNSAYTCFRSGPIRYYAPVGPVYIVIHCTNFLETCNLQYNVDLTCQSADPCDGMSCNNGHCSLGRCICDSGYSGTFCDQNDCLSTCKNGNCIAGSCICNSGYSGTYCDQSDCLNKCNNGDCNGGTCTCISGYGGVYCTYNVEVYGDGGLHGAAVIGLICGGVALFVIIVVVVGVVLYRRQRRRRSGEIELVANEVAPQ